jgi:phosphoglycolate phosphatase-like HAD superfamily hydrolase
MQKKVFIFDCDGVIREFSMDAVYNAYCIIADILHADLLSMCPDLDAFKRWFDHDWRKNLYKMGITSPDGQSMASQIFQIHYDHRITTFPWVSEIFEQLVRHGYIAILSNSGVASINRSLNGITRHVSMVVGHDNISRLKPHPDGINHIMRTFNGKMRDVVMIGDSDADIEAGRRAGVRTVAVSWGATQTHEDLSALRADMIIHAPEELLSM